MATANTLSSQNEFLLHRSRGLELHRRMVIVRMHRLMRAGWRRDLIQSRWKVRQAKRALASLPLCAATFDVEVSSSLRLRLALEDLKISEQSALEAGAWTVRFAVTRKWVREGRGADA